MKRNIYVDGWAETRMNNIFAVPRCCVWLIISVVTWTYFLPIYQHSIGVFLTPGWTYVIVFPAFRERSEERLPSVLQGACCGGGLYSWRAFAICVNHSVSFSRCMPLLVMLCLGVHAKKIHLMNQIDRMFSCA